MTLQIFFLVSAVLMTTGGGKGDNGREEALKLSRGEVVFGGKGGQERPRRGRKRGGKGKMGGGKGKMGGGKEEKEGMGRKKWGKCLEDMVFICIFAQ